MTIVMGLDQHRAQITAEWLDTETGEVSRARVTPADRAGVAAVLGAVCRPAARGGVGGHDRLAVRGRGAARDRRRAASGRAGRSERAEGQQEARQDRPRRRAASARAVDDRAGCRSPTSRPSTCSICAPGCGCVTRWSISAASGSSASTRCSITTGTRRRPGCSPPRTARGLSGSRCRMRHANRSRVALAMIDALDAQSRRSRPSCVATRAARPAAAR